MSKRKAIDAFFKPAAPKKPAPARPQPERDELPASDLPPFAHETYPFPQPHLPPHLSAGLAAIPATNGVVVNDRPSLELLSFTPLIPRATADALFHWLRRALFFYRVMYSIQRGPTRTEVVTPRYTTVFGVDATSVFAPPPAGGGGAPGALLDAGSQTPVPRGRYAPARPRPLPPALAELKALVEACTDATYNFCLVNYYARGEDSIAWHSDDERFLGPAPAIASLSLGAARDFCLKPKPPKPHDGSAGAVATAAAGSKGPVRGKQGDSSDVIKMALRSGDMVLMRGGTQGAWLHSVPKRRGGEADKGRINITFRRALVPAGTENYYRYNVGTGGTWKWDEAKEEMVP